MSIAQKLEINHKNQIENIKKEKNREAKIRQIGALVLDVGNRSIKAIAKEINCSRKFVKYCYVVAKENLQIENNRYKCGRKKLIVRFPKLEQDIRKIVENHCSTDPRFKTEKQYVRLSIAEIKRQLLETGSYEEKSFSNSYLNNLVNEMGYNLKKVQKTKPLKKIKETNLIFENVHKKKEKAMQEENTVLISLDTKDKVLLGPFSRNGKNRKQIKAVDHNLTNNCLIPFDLLDIKTDIPYFFNFKEKPTSLDLVECIGEFLNDQYANGKQKKLAILLDNGPDNSGVRTIFLKGLIELSKRYNMEIELIYYPPYHSKYNPVERLWARLENIWNGYLLETVEICLHFMQNLTWKNKKSITKLKEIKYEKGLTVNKKEMLELEQRHILRNETIKKWSLIITP